MRLKWNSLISKRLKIVCVFGDTDKPIYYDGTLLGYDLEGKFIEIKDKHGKNVFIDIDTIKQVAIIED